MTDGRLKRFPVLPPYFAAPQNTAKETYFKKKADSLALSAFRKERQEQ